MVAETSRKLVEFCWCPHIHGSLKVGSIVEGPMLSKGCWESGCGVVDWVSWDIENLKWKLVDTYLQKATRIIFLNDLQAVLHETCGLAQFHCAVRDLISNHLRLMREQNSPKWHRVKKKQTVVLKGHLLQVPLAPHLPELTLWAVLSGRSWRVYEGAEQPEVRLQLLFCEQSPTCSHPVPLF